MTDDEPGQHYAIDRLEAVVKRFERAARGGTGWTWRKIFATSVGLLAAVGGGSYGGAGIWHAQMELRLAAVEREAAVRHSQEQVIQGDLNETRGDVRVLQSTIDQHEREITRLRDRLESRRSRSSSRLPSPLSLGEMIAWSINEQPTLPRIEAARPRP